MELLNNITLLTNPKLDLHNITILGLHFGMSSTQIPAALKREMPHAGWTHSNEKGVTIRTAQEAPFGIVEFLLYPSVLQGLHLETKQQVEQLFGKASGIEQNSGSTFFFYEQQQIVINWNNEANQLDSIYLGVENRVQQTRYTIQDFLNKYYEFKAMVPDIQNWTTEKLAYNPPRFYRLKELEAFLKAFDLGDNLLDFMNQGFLRKRTVEHFTLIMKDIEKYAFTREIETKNWEKEKVRLSRPPAIKMLIRTFFRFSEEMRQLFKFNNGWLATGSIAARYSIHKTQKLLDKIDRTELEEIETLLGSILAPDNQSFTKNELIKMYDFPDVDLQAIDWDHY